MSNQDHAYALPSGFMLEEYRLDGVLGSGGFGITYYARDTHLNKAVAIKEYLPNESAMRYEDTTVAPRSSSHAETYDWGLTRFLEEAQVLAGFDHPNINRVHRRLQAHGTAYIVLEYLSGGSLSDRLKRTGRLSPDEVWRLFNELSSGLAEVHRQDYVHRDIKPGNIMFREEGSAVLVDFGAARQVVGQRTKNITSLLTQGYAPIEQYDQKAVYVGPWTDFYALGVVAYRCVTGVREGELLDAPARSLLVLHGEREKDMPPAVELAKGEYDQRLLKAIDWCMQVDKRERPQGVADLEKALTKEPEPKPKPKPPASSRRADELRALAVAAEQGDAEAQFKLGVRYEKGRGVSRDDEEAVKWYRLAAEQGLADAQYNLGWMYDEGHGVPRDDEEAVIWYRLAAEQGHDDAQYTLGEMYREGEGVPQDDGMAMKWFGLAAEQGNTSAQRNLERLRQTPKPKPKPKPKQKTPASSRRADELRALAERGDAQAQFNLGVKYANGRGVRQDDEEAVKWFTLAAEQGDASAQFSLGVMYEKGHGVSRDDDEAVKWYRLAAKQGYANAQRNLRRLTTENAVIVWLAVGVLLLGLGAGAWQWLSSSAAPPLADDSGKASAPAVVTAPPAPPQVAAEEPGSLILELEPRDAQVMLPDIESPYRPGLELPAGEYRVVVRREGYGEFNGTLRIDAGRRTIRAIALLRTMSGHTVGSVFRDALRSSGQGPEMVVLPTGSFQKRYEGFPKTVTINYPIAMSKYEVTFAEYDRFALATNAKKPRAHGWGRGMRPVINVSWHDANAYAKWLSQQTGKTYRLPSETEWEYAARAGTTTKYSWGDEIGRNRANCDGCASRWDGKTAPVGSFAANGFGLHDMHGNVSEWVEDCYDEDRDARVPSDGRARTRCNYFEPRRVRRGGSWGDDPQYRNLCSACRNNSTPFGQNAYNGFRLVRELP